LFEEWFRETFAYYSVCERFDADHSSIMCDSAHDVLALLLLAGRPKLYWWVIRLSPWGARYNTVCICKRALLSTARHYRTIDHNIVGAQIRPRAQRVNNCVHSHMYIGQMSVLLTLLASQQKKQVREIKVLNYSTAVFKQHLMVGYYWPM